MKRLVIIILLSLGIFSCKSLQKTKGYKHYQQNTYWNNKEFKA